MLPMFGRRPLTRLELGLYVAIVGIAAAIFLDRLLAAMELAERAAMQETVSRVNSAINLRIAYQMLNGQLINVRAALVSNPFELAKTAPPNYRGESDKLDVARIESGSWFFDSTRRELVYMPRLKRSLITADGSGLVRFRLVAGPSGTHYMLVPTYKYTWD
ncbi:MAG: hypothetical protein QOD26_753 [Betaproteobacteria bacterium]|jgi:type II secretory pathway pseudopilin PulG|nr:hypothetical protein [Betaproteobacteria bacterium]